VVLESFTNRQPQLGLVKDSRTSDSWLGLLVILDKDLKLETTMNISNLFVSLAEYSAIRVEGLRQP
jgi:RNA polymerase subunit RPABC4/transcription elongation factor Spt4